MTTINRNFKTSSGKSAVVNLTIENHKVSGTATINGQAYGVSGFATVQGKKVLQIKGASAPYLPIPNDLYNDLNTACKSQFAASMTQAQIVEGEMREAEARYNKLFAQGHNNAEIIKAKAEWDRLSAEYNKIRK